MIYCGKAGFGQISRSFASNSGAILFKTPKNLTQTGFWVKSRRSPVTKFNVINFRFRPRAALSPAPRR